ncbi:MAG TPA: hypothetical protein PK054_01015 [Anaerohalosphaeraceae bacterium]|nr:hypothetical protein [Anaerohalosphaeraceae bacterium]HOL87792.1 hypothetical protein [Anaerohalosphaeraceae bacterium]HPP55144.1 hypothetical protein [Anaerohalosphaeraceae bacterium]
MAAVSRSSRTGPILIPELELEHFQPPVSEAGPVRLPVGSVQFGWVGAGAAGCRLAEWFYRLGYRKTIAVSADEKHLRTLNLPDRQKCLWPAALPKRLRFSSPKESPRTIGRDLFGRMEEIFGEDADFLMLCLSEEESEKGGLVCSLMDVVNSYARLLGFRRPGRTAGVFLLESQHLRSNFHGSIRPMVAAGSQVGGGRRQANEDFVRRHAELFALFNRLSAQPTPYLTFDSMDYLDVLTAGGWTVMGESRLSEPPDRSSISRAVRQALEQCTLGGRFSLKQTQAAACLMVGGQEMMADIPGLPDVLLYGFDVLTALLGRARVHRGIYEDQDTSLRIYVLLSGLQPQS